MAVLASLCAIAMTRHTLVGLSIVFRTRPDESKPDRLPPETLAALRVTLAAGIQLKDDQTDLRLTELRRMYEPYGPALASYFRLKVPPWIAEENRVDDWQASTWERRLLRVKQAGGAEGEHF